MSQVSQPSKFDEIQSWEQGRVKVTNFAEEMKRVVNGNLEFVTNLKCQIIDCTFATSGVVYQFPHLLGKIPSGYFAVSMDRPAILYLDSGAGGNGANFIKLQSNVAGLVAKVLVF